MANIINFNEDDKNKQNNAGQPASAQPANIAPVSGQQSAPQQGPASSGQFTNIQKYLNANKGAGQQISGGVQQQLNKGIQPLKTQQESQANQFKQSVQNANDVLGRGQQYNQQLQAPVASTTGIMPVAAGIQNTMNQGLGSETASAAMTKAQATGQQPIQPVNAFDPNSIVNDQNKLTDFTKIRLGQGVDENTLKSQAQQAQDTAAGLQQKASDLAQQTASAQGRSGLVNQAFSRPGYTQGQQRMDNLFLSGAGQQGVNAIRNVAKQNVSQAGNIYSQAQAGTKQAGDVATQEQNIQKSLQDSANALESGYMQNLQNLIPEVNKQRDAEKARWQQNYDVLTGAKQGTIDQDIFDQLGLKSGERTYNVLTDPNLNLRQIANISDYNAATAQDVASQKDVDYYNALAKLSKGGLDTSGAFTGPDASQLQLQGASKMGTAASALTGENSLRNKLNSADQSFQDYLKNAVIGAQGSDAGSSGVFGSGGNATATAQVKLADFLNGGQPNVRGQTVGANSGIVGAVGSAMGNNPLINVGVTGGFAGLLAPVLGNNALTNSFGGSAGSGSAAQFRAQNTLLDQIASQLNGKGFGNVLTQTGNKQLGDIIQHGADLSQEQLDDQWRKPIYNMTDDQIKSEYGNVDKYYKAPILKTFDPQQATLNGSSGGLSSVRMDPDLENAPLLAEAKRAAQEQANIAVSQALATRNAGNAGYSKVRSDMANQIQNRLGSGVSSDAINQILRLVGNK